MPSHWLVYVAISWKVVCLRLPLLSPSQFWCIFRLLGHVHLLVMFTFMPCISMCLLIHSNCRSPSRCLILSPLQWYLSMICCIDFYDHGFGFVFYHVCHVKMNCSWCNHHKRYFIDVHYIDCKIDITMFFEHSIWQIVKCIKYYPFLEFSALLSLLDLLG